MNKLQPDSLALLTKHLKSFVFLILLMGCDRTFVDEFVVENQTEHNIRIEGFARNAFDYNQDTIRKLEKVNPETILIPANSKYTAFQATRGFQATDPEGIFIQWYIDSVNIFFDDKKVSSQFCDSIFYLGACSIAILDIENNYTREKRNRREYRFIYEVTEEDYENADFIQK